MAGVIVVGYDGTDGGKAALGSAIGLAKELGDSIVLTFGYEPSQFPDEMGDYEAAVKELGERVTAEAMKLLESEGVKAEVELVPDGAAESLVKVAGDRAARMIVVGSYGQRPLTGAILGSTPHRLLHLAEHPVLVVRA